jgi:hypothetical protein
MNLAQRRFSSQMNIVCPIDDRIKSRVDDSNVIGELYPQDKDLPWHFSWIDDGSIGGSSAPAERQNYAAFARHNVKLVVNLMESPCCESSLPQCNQCDYENKVTYDDNLFTFASSDIHCLWLPVIDGTVPQAEQVSIFLKHAFETIKSGGKVVVHCQAGTYI